MLVVSICSLNKHGPTAFQQRSVIFKYKAEAPARPAGTPAETSGWGGAAQVFLGGSELFRESQAGPGEGGSGGTGRVKPNAAEPAGSAKPGLGPAPPTRGASRARPPRSLRRPTSAADESSFSGRRSWPCPRPAALGILRLPVRPSRSLTAPHDTAPHTPRRFRAPGSRESAAPAPAPPGAARAYRESCPRRVPSGRAEGGAAFPSEPALPCGRGRSPQSRPCPAGGAAPLKTLPSGSRPHPGGGRRCQSRADDAEANAAGLNRAEAGWIWSSLALLHSPITLWPEVTSENHRIVWIERDLWILHSPSTWQCRVTWNMSRWIWDVSRDGDSTIPLGSCSALCHLQHKVLPCLHMKHSFLVHGQCSLSCCWAPPKRVWHHSLGTHLEDIYLHINEHVGLWGGQLMSVEPNQNALLFYWPSKRGFPVLILVAVLSSCPITLFINSCLLVSYK